MQKDANRDIWISRIGLGLIFTYCLAVSIFFSWFAQLHIQLSFLPFPIFIGEILLLICLVLLVFICQNTAFFSRRVVVLLSLYFSWIIIKGAINYHYDGPLTCRNAALFYYPIFAVFAYCFYRKARIPGKVLMSLVVLAAGIMFFKVMVLWYWWTYVVLYVIAVWNTKSVLWRWLGWVFLAAIFLLEKEYIYLGPRAHFVSIFGAVVFLVFYFGFLLVKQRRRGVLSALIIGFFVFTTGFLVFGDYNDIHSILSFKSMVYTYKIFDRSYQNRLKTFVPQKFSSVHLYNPKKLNDLFVPPSTTPTAVSVISKLNLSPVGSQSAAAVVVKPTPALISSSPVVAVTVVSKPTPIPVSSQPVTVVEVKSTPIPVSIQPVVVMATKPTPAPVSSPPVVAVVVKPTPQPVSSQPVTVVEVKSTPIPVSIQPVVVMATKPTPAPVSSPPVVAVVVKPTPQPVSSQPVTVVEVKSTPIPVSIQPVVVMAAKPTPPPASSPPAVVVTVAAKPTPPPVISPPTVVVAVAAKPTPPPVISPPAVVVAVVAKPTPPPVSSSPAGPPSAVAAATKYLLNNVMTSQIREGRLLETDEHNISFRLLIWRDMIREFINDPHAWFWGFSFGHPQRSKSLEVLHWAESEWGRDGWICPHNSFLHIIYRGSIFGICFIGLLFYMLGRLIKDFLALNSVEGGLLIGILVYWMILSNFFVVLEFPYHAIVIWTLFGITCAYRDALKATA